MGVDLVFRGGGSEASVTLDPARIVRFGRSRRCNVVVSHPTVSAEHAELRLEADRLVLQDLASRNGTFLNDIRTDEDVVRPGDRIRLGSAELVLLLGRDLGESSPEDRALYGVAENLSPADLVQILASNGKTGSLMFFQDRFGRIDFKEGRVCYAMAGGIEGEKAFHRILSWNGADYQFRGRRPEQENIEIATDRLLVDTMRLGEEMETLRAELPHPDTELIRRAGKGEADLSAADSEILDGLVESKTLACLMDASPRLDVEVARAVARLLRAGLLFARR